jgi:hypothetical protein
MTRALGYSMYGSCGTYGNKEIEEYFNLIRSRYFQNVSKPADAIQEERKAGVFLSA